MTERTESNVSPAEVNVTPSQEELQQARRDWENVNKLHIEIGGMHHTPFIQKHMDSGGNIVGFSSHQAHPDFLVLLRSMLHVAGGQRIQLVHFPASSKLYPGGDLYDTDGRRMFAFGELLNVNYHKMVQHYNQDESLYAAKVNLRAFKEIRDTFAENSNVFLGYFFEGGRGNGDGVLQRAQEGAEFIFTSRQNNIDDLKENDKALGIPVRIDNTRYLMRNKFERAFSFLFTTFEVRIGQPFFARDILEDMEEFGHSFSDTIGARVASLIPYSKRYQRGHYSNANFRELISYSERRNKQMYGT